MASVKKIVRKYFPIYNFFFFRSYSQEGEDMVLRSFYELKKNYKGFFVDVGAHHPYRYSNTMHFYKKGWRGINIEPTPKGYKLFKYFRKNDINLNLGVSEVKDKLKFYCFNEPALNGFSKEISERRNSTSDKYKIIKTLDIETQPLSAILDEYLPVNQIIDFLTIDVEGFDLMVLKSNNWDRYRPIFILIEDNIDFENLTTSKVYNFLKDKGYKLVSKTLRTMFFKLTN